MVARSSPAGQAGQARPASQNLSVVTSVINLFIGYKIDIAICVVGSALPLPMLVVWSAAVGDVARSPAPLLLWECPLVAGAL